MTPGQKENFLPSLVKPFGPNKPKRLDLKKIKSRKLHTLLLASGLILGLALAMMQPASAADAATDTSQENNTTFLQATSDTAPTIDNGVPVLYLNIDESQGTIEDMIASEDHSVYCYGTVSIDVPEGFHYSDSGELSIG